MLKFLFRCAVAAGVGAFVWQSLPDLKRYLRITRM
ncbi:DUF6893 family small protein [Kitasatospora sp. LaBMicrA B282]